MPPGNKPLPEIVLTILCHNNKYIQKYQSLLYYNFISNKLHFNNQWHIHILNDFVDGRHITGSDTNHLSLELFTALITV